MAKKRAAKTASKRGTSAASAQSRRAIFVEAYIANGGNATEAAKTAGYSEKSARYQGSKMLADTAISQQIAQKSQQVAMKYELTKELVVRSIVQELTFDPAKLYGKDGRLLPVTELPEDVRMALTSVEFEQLGSPDAPVYVRKVKWAQRQGAREQAMKHLGLFLEDNKQKHPVQDLADDALDLLIARKAKELGVTVH